MKKALLIAMSAGLMVSAVNAQPFKQTGNENNLQLLIAPLGNTPVSLNDGIMYRRFFSNGTMAVRLGLSVGNSKSTDITQNENDTLSFPTTIDVYPSFPYPGYTLLTGLNPELQTESKTSWFSIKPGVEKHFAGTERISPYVGLEISFMSSKSTFKRDTLAEGNYTVTLRDTTTSMATVSAPWTKYTLNQKSGYKTFGVNLIAGMDYYFTKNLSLGLEFGFGFYSTKYDDNESEFVKNTMTEVETGPDANGVSTNTISNANTISSAPAQKGGKDSGFGPNVVTKLKIGWLF